MDISEFIMKKHISKSDITKAIDLLKLDLQSKSVESVLTPILEDFARLYNYYQTSSSCIGQDHAKTREMAALSCTGLNCLLCEALKLIYDYHNSFKNGYIGDK